MAHVDFALQRVSTVVIVTVMAPPKVTRDTLPARFWARVNKNGPTLRPELGPCWTWLGGRVNGGYGLTYVCTRKTERAHRVALELTGGALSLSAVVCHRCDNPICVRPDHLFVGTHLDNHRDMRSKGRTPMIGETHPQAKLNPDQVRDIRRGYAVGDSQKTLASRHGVSRATIYMVTSRRLWGHVK